MPQSSLPDRPSLEYLKKLAKERLKELRHSQPDARLADAQLAIAREHGFASWRALRAEVERRGAASIDAFIAACLAGDVETLRSMLEREPELVAARNADGATGLHAAVQHPEAVRLLLERGADPNVRDVGDNALPLHFAAGAPLDSARALLEAGSDPVGAGDAHALEVIGWATCFDEARREVVDLLVARGAKHHVFSAVALGDTDLLRRIVAEDPAALRRRLSGTEQEQTALHYVIAPPDGLLGGRFRTGEHYRTLATLLELGADVDATDAKGRTPLDIAMLRGDDEAMRMLHAAGAKPRPLPEARDRTPTSLAPSIGKLTPMLTVSDVDAAIAWYRAVGFELTGSHADGGRIDWASMRFGEAEIMLVPGREAPAVPNRPVSLWIHTDRLDELYALLQRRQLEHARARMSGEPGHGPEIRFKGDLYTAFYGQREFSISDPDGLELIFFQPLEA